MRFESIKTRILPQTRRFIILSFFAFTNISFPTWARAQVSIPGECFFHPVMAILAEPCARALDIMGKFEAAKREYEQTVRRFNELVSEINSIVEILDSLRDQLITPEKLLTELDRKLGLTDRHLQQLRPLKETYVRFKNAQGQYEQLLKGAIQLVPALEIERFSAQFETAARLLDEALALVEEALQRLGLDVGSLLPLGELSSEFDLTLNPITSTFWASANFPWGIKFNNSMVNELLAGNLRAPADVNWLDLALTQVPLKKVVQSDWHSWASAKRSELPSFSYVGSKRLTDWLGLDTAAHKAITAVLTGGGSSTDLLDEAKSMIALEWSDLQSFAHSFEGLRPNRDRIAGHVIKSLLELDTGRLRFRPRQGIEAISRVEQLSYNYRLELDPSRFTPAAKQLFEVMRVDLSNSLGQYSIPHMSFTLSVAIADGAQERAPTARQLAASFLSRHGALTSLDGLTEHLTRLGIDPNFVGWVKNRGVNGVGRQIASSVSERLFGNWSELASLLQSRSSQGYIIDVSNAALSRNISSLLKPLALGDGSISLERAEIDLRSGSIGLTAKINHRLSIRTLRETTRHVTRWVRDRKTDLLARAKLSRGIKGLVDRGALSPKELSTLAHGTGVLEKVTSVAEPCDASGPFGNFVCGIGTEEFDIVGGADPELIYTAPSTAPTSIVDQIRDLQYVREKHTMLALQIERRDWKIRSVESQKQSLNMRRRDAAGNITEIRSRVPILETRERTLRSESDRLNIELQSLFRRTTDLYNQLAGIRWPEIPVISDDIFGGECSFFRKPGGC